MGARENVEERERERERWDRERGKREREGGKETSSFLRIKFN